MDMQNTELNTESSEELCDFTEEEREQIISESLMICAKALQDLRQDVSELRADFSALYQKD